MGETWWNTPAASLGARAHPDVMAMKWSSAKALVDLPWVDLEDLPQIPHSSNKEWHEQHLNATEPTFQFHL